MKEYDSNYFGFPSGQILREIDKEDVILPSDENITNKGDCGRVLVIGSDVGMAGASVFSATSAYRTGSGLVYVHTHPENRIVVQNLIPEAVASFWGEDEKLKKLLSTADTIVLGVGIGKSSSAKKIVSDVIANATCPMVIDADALNIISEDKGMLKALPENTVITPHLGELSRLTTKPVATLHENLPAFALSLALKYRINVLAKDKISVFAASDGELYAESRGTRALSTGGSGDVLTGIIASLIGQGTDVKKSVLYGIYIHAMAGRLAGEELSEKSVMARDIINCIPKIIKQNG